MKYLSHARSQKSAIESCFRGLIAQRSPQQPKAIGGLMAEHLAAEKSVFFEFKAYFDKIQCLETWHRN